MATAGVSRIELLGKDNFDTWKLQVQAILIKADLWEYVSGTVVKPEPGQNNVNAANVAAWERNDQKARSDIILSISPSELKQVKNCTTSRDMWLRLGEIYQSKGPARKATLLKRLTLQKMGDNEDVRVHLDNFFDSVDKLADMNVDINADLLTILLLYSLPSSYENFRCAIESRDELPTPEALRIKIVEENDARKSDVRNVSSGAMFVRKQFGGNKKNKSNRGNENKQSVGEAVRCFKCKLMGHRAKDCPNKSKSAETAKCADDVCLNVSAGFVNGPNLKWCLDSGATSHFCNEAGNFREMYDANRGSLNLANRQTTVSAGTGKAYFSANVLGKRKHVTLDNALLVPDLRANLLSVGKIADLGFEVTFRKDGAVVTDRDGKLVLNADRFDGLYYIREFDQDANTLSVPDNKVSIDLLHRRLGHANVRDIADAIRKGFVKGVQLEKSDGKLNCDTCLKCKMTRTPFPKRSERQTRILDLIHTDVCGPMREASHGKARYFVEFIDDYSGWCEVRFVKTKAEVFKVTTEYISLVENQKGTTVKCLQSDNGREYTSNEFNEFLKRKGIARRLTVPHNPEQNGTAERRNRTLNDMARCILKESNLPNSFWAEAVNTANFIRNRLPTKSLNGRTPHEAWTGRAPDISNFRTFGCKVFYLDRDPGKGKFDSRGREGVFLGYADESKAYRVWSSEKRRVVITRDVKFLEDALPQPDVGVGVSSRQDVKDKDVVNAQNSIEFEFTSKPVEQEVTRDDGRDSDDLYFEAEGSTSESSSETSDDEEGPFLGFPDALEDPFHSADEAPTVGDVGGNIGCRACGRPGTNRSGSRGRPTRQFHSTQNLVANVVEMEQSFLSEVPMKVAMSGDDAGEWREAIATEMKCILKNETWTLVDQPTGHDVIGSRMVLRNKWRPDGTLDKRKARLVAQGFKHRLGIHFAETFAPVARIGSIRLMASLAAKYGMKIQQFDVETAYLNGRLKRDVYMLPPQNLDEILQDVINSEKQSHVGILGRKMLSDLRKGKKVCLLKKSLYGLPQAGRNWYEELADKLIKLGATPSKGDPCLFHIGSGEDITLIATYVDDILVASRDQKKIDELRRGLSKHFEIKNIGPAKHCLGIEFQQSKQRVTMSQPGYIRSLLERFKMTECHPVVTPLDPGLKLKKAEVQSDEDLKLPYRELVGALTYLASTTRPDISYAVSFLGQFNNCYSSEHWKVAKRVVRYLKGTIDMGLAFSPDSKPMNGFVDADWGNATEDRRSFSGYVFLLGGGPVSWESRKQRTVALSTTEAEYMALSECVKEAIYLRRFVNELGFINLSNMTIFCDNQSALKLAENPVYHSRSKHIDIRHHFVRDVVKHKELRVASISTDDQAADLLTKSLPGTRHKKCLELLKLSKVDQS